MKKVLVLTGLVFLSFSTLMAQWNLVGDAIVGDNTEYQELKFVEISADGTTIIAGSTVGAVMVYQNDGSDSWMKVGDTFTDESPSMNLYGEVTINADGTIVAMKGGQWGGDEYVCVYERSGNDWQLLGDTINSETAGIQFGVSLSLNYDGDIIAIGATNDNSNTGSLSIYEFSGSDWVLKGDKILGETSEMMGWDADLSANGNTVIVGSKYNGDGGTASVYEFSEGIWSQKGTQLTADGSNDNFGASVTINYDGSVIAVGAPKSGDDIGMVKVYEYSETNWVQVGETFNGNSENSLAGSSIALNAAGNMLAVGSPGYAIAGGNEARGCVDVLKLYNGIWRPYGNNELPGYSLYGETQDDDNMGTYVSLDSIGSTVAIGIPGRNANAVNQSGVIEVYRNANISNDIACLGNENVKIYPTVVSNELIIEASKPALLELISIQGCVVYSSQINDDVIKIDMRGVEMGLYIINIQIEDRIFSSKIIKN